MPTQRPTNDTTELAKERNRQAAERTLTSWIQNALGLIGFGATFQSIFEAINDSFPGNDPLINQNIAYAIGLSAIGLGIFLLVPVLIPYRNHLQSLASKNFLDRPLRLFDLRLIVISISLYGLIAAIAVLLAK